MSSMNNYHPFRASVTHDAASPASSPQPAAADGGEGNGGEETSFFSPKTKVRICIGLSATVALLYVGMLVVDDFSPPAEKELVLPEGMYGEDSDEEMFNYDRHDLDARGRTIAESKHKAGWFASLFCRGGQKNRFCD